MLDVAAIRVAFPEVIALAPLIQSGQKDVLRGQFNGEEIVLKLLRAPTPDAEARILREIEAVTSLHCGYVPPIRASGRRRIGGHERAFIIEKFMAGETYRDRLQRQPVQPLKAVLDLADALLQAVGDFEGAKLVHRDIKPENLIVGTDGRIWIIDFGIVRMLDLESITSTGAPAGSFTPGYGAPEQMRNLKPRIDIRADLFSVGVVLYESLVGANPYLVGAANQLEVMHRVDNQDLLPLVIAGDRDGALSAFIMSMASRFPSRRPQTAQQARAWFDDIRPTLMKQ
jgi:eukaryotic-like serine/threonine-protein kinase